MVLQGAEKGQDPYRRAAASGTLAWRNDDALCAAAEEYRMTASHPRVVVVGAGHAGGTFAALLRQYGHQGPIALIGEEPLAPYQRPRFPRPG